LPEQEPEEEHLRRLMVAYQAGDIAAFDALYSPLVARMKRYLGGLSRDDERVDDLMQETFLRVHKARHSYDPTLPLLPWVYAIARHVFLMDRRQRHRRPATAMPDVGAVLASPASERPWAGVEVDRLLRQIEHERRDAIVLHHLWGLRFDEIAARLGITEGAARARAHRAMEAMRRFLGKRVR
jgi:RNA polymerase sigma-70 factor, ECF subfamily